MGLRGRGNRMNVLQPLVVYSFVFHWSPLFLWLEHAPIDCSLGIFFTLCDSGVIKVMLDALTIDDELVSLTVQQYNSSVRSDFLNGEGSGPSRFQLAWEQPMSEVEEQDLIVWFETSGNDSLVMVGFVLLLINFGTLIGEVPYLFQLMDLDHALLSCWLDVEIQ
ncbi:hypothetical protein Bca101_070545 [Brassica carinata]